MSIKVSIDDTDLPYIRRAAYLASVAVGVASPNPQVGAVLVLGRRIISEGLFRADGGPHAEIDALSRLPQHYRSRLAEATMYVSLEPCSIFGRTPPCADRLLAEGIGAVVVGALDFTPGVCGEGLRKLRVGGAVVGFGIGQAVCFALARPRNVFATQRRPYIILKQAVSYDGYVGRTGGSIRITGDIANLLNHRWRAENDAILIGSRTFSTDKPTLSTRHVAGPSPEVVVFDPGGRLSYEQVGAHFAGTRLGNRKVYLASAKPASLNIEDKFTIRLPIGLHAPVADLLRELYERRIGRLLVEGGPATLRVFAEAGLWDELREWQSPSVLAAGSGRPVRAYRPAGLLQEEHRVGVDTLSVYSRSPR